MNKKDRKRVGSAMLTMANQDDNFAVVHAFFRDLGAVDGAEYIAMCRERMPMVADALARGSEGVLAASSVIRSMQLARTMPDKNIVALSAMALDLVTRTVLQAIDNSS